MRNAPECLNRRYLALDDLIRELNKALSEEPSQINDDPSDNVGIKLMCDLWEILKENPDCDLAYEVQQRLCTENPSQGIFAPQQVTCYMANSASNDKSCCRSTRPPSSPRSQNSNESQSSSKMPCCGKGSKTCNKEKAMPLSGALCCLKEAASFEKKCSDRINALMGTQKELEEQIKVLEEREKSGMEMLKQADCMWSCMEGSYKQKIADSMERQNILIQQMKEVEKSSNKWRKNKKDLDSQLENVRKCHQEIKEKINQKINDKKFMDTEIANYQHRIDVAQSCLQASKNSEGSKRAASDAKIQKVMAEMAKLQQRLAEEDEYKKSKEQEGTGYVKEAREELQKICKALLKKNVEFEDLTAEKQALLEEIEFLKQACTSCKDKCKKRQNSITQRIKELNKEIAGFKNQCLRCHQYTDTNDTRNWCTDCPRCLKQIECLIEGDHCIRDPKTACICTNVKHKFMDNVFDNMYTVLAKQAKTGAGKAIADRIVKCLKKSTNGKLDVETRKILQEFVLTTVKKNLNLTIIGGAVKTRCELDSEAYNQLMLCLKHVKPKAPPKEDKATPVKKDPCGRWGDVSECNCPKGPKFCICSQKAPPRVHDPKPCPPPVKEDMVDAKACPYKEETVPCGPDCGMHNAPSAVGTDVAAWKPDPCKQTGCPFTKNMRAAQCVLGPERLSPSLETEKSDKVVRLENKKDSVRGCDCSTVPLKSYPNVDCRGQPRQQIIDEVMGKYDILPIEKVKNMVMARLPPEKEHKNNSKPLYKEFMENSVIKGRSTSKQQDKVVLKNNIKSFKNKNGRTDIDTILCPRLTPFSKKNDRSTLVNKRETNNTISGKSNLLPRKRNADPVGNSDSYDFKYVGRKVRHTVRELLKEIVVPNTSLKSTENTEWITAASLYKELDKINNLDCRSNSSDYEIETSSEILDERIA